MSDQKKLPDKKPVAKTCPECGPAVNLIVRTNSNTEQQFLGCPNFPECRHTEEIPLDIQLKLLGAKRLL